MATLNSTLVLSLKDQAAGPLGRLSGALNGLNKRMSFMGGGFGRALVGVGALVGLREAFQGTVGASIAFEEKFAEVRKVVDGSPAQMDQLRGSILNLSKVMPVAADQLADIMGAAGQAGIPFKDLSEFTEFAAKAAVAFDMTGGEIGDRFAKLRNVFKLSQAGIEDLANSSNLLSNEMASTADGITDFVNRAAGSAEVLNLLPRQLAAVGSAMTSAGIAPETAARGLSAFTNKIVAGGPKVRSAFKAIGLSFKEWRQLQKKNGPEALVQLFDHASKKGEKGLKALQDLVGQDFSDDFSKLLANPNLLKQAFGMVADATKVAGSVQAEFINKSDTAAAKIQQMNNNLQALGIAIGDVVSPTLGNWAKELADIFSTLDKRVTVFDRLGADVKGFMTGLGLNGPDFSKGWTSFRDSVFGKPGELDADIDTMGASFEKFRKMGTDLRSLFAGDGFSGDKLKTLGTSFRDLSGSVSLGGMAAIGVGAVALQALSKSILGIGFGTGLKLGALAVGLNGLATSGLNMSAVEWASLGSGLAAFAGGLRGLIVLQGLLAIIDSIKKFGPEVAEKRREPKKGEPLDYLNEWAGYKIQGTREERETALRKSGVGISTPPVSAAPQSDWERDIQGLPAPEKPLAPSVMNNNLPGIDDVAAALKSVIKTQPIGVSDVRVTNPVRPNVNVSTSVTVNVQSNASPQAIGNQVGAAIGEKTKAAVESTYTDGGL